MTAAKPKKKKSSSPQCYSATSRPKNLAMFLYSVIIFGWGSHKIVIKRDGFYETWGHRDYGKGMSWQRKDYSTLKDKDWSFTEIPVDPKELSLQCNIKENTPFNIFDNCCYFVVSDILRSLDCNYYKLLS